MKRAISIIVLMTLFVGCLYCAANDSMSWAVGEWTDLKTGYTLTIADTGFISKIDARIINSWTSHSRMVGERTIEYTFYKDRIPIQVVVIERVREGVGSISTYKISQNSRADVYVQWEDETEPAKK